MLNRYDRSPPMNGEAEVKYLDGDFRVVRPGAYVRCVVTGEPIPLDELRYWSVDRQEAYVNEVAESLTKLATSQQDIDAATAALKQAKAQVMLAEAQVTQNSPVPQRIGETDAQVGQLKGQVEQAQGRLD